MDIGEAFATFKKSAKRLELLQEYRIEGDEWDTFTKFQEGQATPIYAELAEWMEMLDAWQKDGKEVERIRVVENPLTNYLKYEIELGYIPGALHGQKVNFVSKQKFEEISRGSIHTDFWIFDDEIVFELLYDSRGAFLCNREVPKGIYKQLLDELRKNSVPLDIVVKQMREQRVELKLK